MCWRDRSPRDSAGEALGPIRRVIIQRMTEAAHTVAPVTLTTDADATELVRLRETIKAELAGSDESCPLTTILIARLVALDSAGASESQRDPDHERDRAARGGPYRSRGRHRTRSAGAGRARRRPQVGLPDRERISRVDRSGAGGRPRRNRSAGSTFTISNLGMYEIDAFTPIINLPECAILGLGRIVRARS